MARRTAAAWGLLMTLTMAGAAAADESAAAPASMTDRERAQEDRIRQLERTVEVLAEELERTRMEMALPDEPELKSADGLGPGASKVYQVGRGLSIGGYAEGFYRNIVSDKGDDKDRADFLRSVLYVGYKFNDWIIFNSEYEFEHATTSSTESSSGGSVSVEFATLDFLIRDWANIKTGLMLVPMGFINEMHEPPFFFGVNRPEVERRIIPSTWRENGVGLFGNITYDLSYKAYFVNGFNAKGFDAGGLRGGRQKGNRALAEHIAFVGNLDWYPIESLLLSGSVYLGKSGQNQDESDALGSFNIPDTPTLLWELHGQYKDHGLTLRTLFTMAHLDETGSLSRALQRAGEIGPTEAVGGEMLGWYAEIAYDVLPLLWPDTEMSLEPFYRYEYLDTQRDVSEGLTTDQTEEWQLHTAGVSFKPIPNVVIKADYRNRDRRGGELSDEFNLGMGLVF